MEKRWCRNWTDTPLPFVNYGATNAEVQFWSETLDPSHQKLNQAQLWNQLLRYNLIISFAFSTASLQSNSQNASKKVMSITAMPENNSQILQS